MSGLDRFVAVLSLFGETADAWSVQEMAAALHQPASTVYRTVRDLVRSGFLDSATSGRYRLGAVFPRYDRIARKTDPIVRAGGKLLREAVVQARMPCVGLLCRLCNDMVMCVDHEAEASVSFAWSLFERGQPIPMTKGATSKAILAQLPPQQRKKLLLAQKDDSAAADLGQRSDLFASIRRKGYHISYGEIDPALVAIAAPVSIPESGVAASVSLIVEQEVLDREVERRLVLLLVSSASLLTEEIRRLEALDAAGDLAAE